MMDLQNEVLVAFRQKQIIVLLPRPAGAICVSSFNHSGGNISVEESSAAENGGAVLWRAPVAVLGTAPDVCGDCSLLDTLLGSGKTLVEFQRFAFLRCWVDGMDILDILASGVSADFLQPSRSAFQPQVRSTSRNTSLSPVEAFM